MSCICTHEEEEHSSGGSCNGKLGGKKCPCKKHRPVEEAVVTQADLARATMIQKLMQADLSGQKWRM
jgi:hypothetical protein